MCMLCQAEKGYVKEDTIDSRLILKALDIRTSFPTDANIVTVKKALLLAYTKHYFYPVFAPSCATFLKEISNFILSNSAKNNNTTSATSA